MKLLTTSSTKIGKSNSDAWLNAVLYLEPSMDYKQICRASSPGCRASCLTHSGMMRMSNQTNARVSRTSMLLTTPEIFRSTLEKELVALHKKATKTGKRLAIRLNGTSDIDWFDVYRNHPEIQFYEYTKRPDLVLKSQTLENVHMTFSRTENTKPETMQRMIATGVNIAVVFDDKKETPKKIWGMTVISGDEHDRRFEDKQGQIVALTLKGTLAVKAAAKQVGFAI